MEESDHLGDIDVDEVCSMLLVFFTYRRKYYVILKSSSFNVQ
jgi:hypothetical protein